MSYKKNNLNGKRKSFKKYSVNERRAYWVGVGICAERYGDGDRLLNHSDSLLRQSFRNGYEDDNHNNISEGLLKSKK